MASSGIPASCASSTNLIVVNGVLTAGLQTIVHPPLMLVPFSSNHSRRKIPWCNCTYNANWEFINDNLFDELFAGIVRPYTRLASSAYHFTYELAYTISPLASLMVYHLQVLLISLIHLDVHLLIHPFK